MASHVKYQFVLILLNLLNDASSTFARRSLYMSAYSDSETGKSNSSRVTRRDVEQVMSAVVDQSLHYIQILYDKNSEETANHMAETGIRSSGTLGLVVNLYDGSLAQLKLLLRPTEAPTLLLLLCSASNAVHIFRMIHRQRLQSHYVHWIMILGGKKSADEVTIGLDGLVFEGTQVSVIFKGERGSFGVLSSDVDVEGVGRFRYEGTFNLLSAKGRRALSDVIGRDLSLGYLDMKGRELRVAAVNNFGLCNLQYLEDGTIVPSSGTDIYMVKALSQALNFTFRIVNPPDGGYGNPLPNGTVTGMIGLVARREADFAACAISLSNLRKTVVDFPYPVYRSPLGLFSRAPKEKSQVWAIFSPFSLQVWLSLSVAVLAIGPIAAFQSWLASSYAQGRGEVSLQVYSFNFYRSFVVQGNRIQPTNWSQKIIFFSWYLFCLIVWALYSGMLTAVLAIPAFETPIDFLKDLPRAVEQGFDIGVYKDTTNELLFREAKNGIYAETWKLFNHKNRERSFVKGNAFAMDRVLERDFVYIGFMASCEILANKLGRSKIHIGKETFYSTDNGLATPQGVPYTKVFGQVTLRFVEGGLREKWKSDELNRLRASLPRNSEKSKTYAISLVHLQAAFFMIVLGFSTSALVLILENVVHNIHLKDNDETST